MATIKTSRFLFLFRSPVNITLFCIALLYFFLIIFFSWNKYDNRENQKIISGDGKGYYMYLPNTFLNHTISRQKTDHRYLLDHPKAKNKRAINKYSVGPALLQLPFFTVAHIINQNDNPTGFEMIYQKMINLAALFYFLAGLIFFNSFLKQYNLSVKSRVITLLTIPAATNLIIPVIKDPAFSHVYSFFAITAFLYTAKTFFLRFQSNKLLWLGLFLGLIILIRPFNAIIIFTCPFLAGSWKNLITKLTVSVKHYQFYVALVVGLAVICIQILINYLQTGTFILYAYVGEGFYWLEPEAINFLLSFKKGWFLYTPAALITMFGIYFLKKDSIYTLLTYTGFLVLLIYLCSSWWNWYYGSSFGQRPMVDYYALLFLPLGIAYQNICRIGKYVLIGCLILFSSLNLVQSYQYHYAILSPSEMNRTKYKYIFFKTDRAYSYILGGINEVPLYRSQMQEIVRKKVSGPFNLETYYELIEITHHPSEDHRAYYLQMKISLYDKEHLKAIPDESDLPRLIVEYWHNSERISYQFLKLLETPTIKKGQKQHFQYRTVLQEAIKSPVRIKTYLYNPANWEIFIETLDIKISDVK